MIQLFIDLDKNLYEALQKQAARDNIDVEDFIQRHLEYYYG